MKKLISLNLALIFVLSLLACPTFATSEYFYSITVDGVTFNSNEDSNGEGWTYSSENNSLVLDAYNGSAIMASGDLTVYTSNDVTISGTTGDIYSSESCGIVVAGSLYLSNSGNLTINGANNSTAKGGEAIVAPELTLLSDYGAEFVVRGANGSSAIKANNIHLDTRQIEIYGGENASAIYFASRLSVAEKTGAVICSGSSGKYAITYLSGASYEIDPDVNATFYDNSSRIVFSSDTAFIYGDILIDNSVDSKDAVLLAQHLAGWTLNLSTKALAAADVKYDGDVNTSDAVLLAQKLAGWNVTLGK